MVPSVADGIGASNIDGVGACGVGAATGAGGREILRGGFCPETGGVFDAFGFEGRRSAGKRRRNPIR